MSFFKIVKSMKLDNPAFKKIITRFIYFSTLGWWCIQAQAQPLPAICEQTIQSVAVCTQNAIGFYEQRGDIQTANNLKKTLKHFNPEEARADLRKEVAKNGASAAAQQCAETKRPINEAVSQMVTLLTLYGALNENCRRHFIQLQLP